MSVTAVCVYDKLSVKKGLQQLLLCILRMKCIIIISIKNEDTHLNAIKKYLLNLY